MTFKCRRTERWGGADTENRFAILGASTCTATIVYGLWTLQGSSSNRYKWCEERQSLRCKICQKVTLLTVNRYLPSICFPAAFIQIFYRNFVQSDRPTNRPSVRPSDRSTSSSTSSFTHTLQSTLPGLISRDLCAYLVPLLGHSRNIKGNSIRLHKLIKKFHESFCTTSSTERATYPFNTSSAATWLMHATHSLTHSFALCESLQNSLKSPLDHSFGILLLPLQLPAVLVIERTDQHLLWSSLFIFQAPSSH